MFDKSELVSNSKFIEVTVTGSPVGYKATYEDIGVGHGKANVMIRWYLLDPEWKIIGILGLDDDAFMDLGASGNGWMCLDKNPIQKDYLYTGLLENKSTGERAILDPTIKNGGGA